MEQCRSKQFQITNATNAQKNSVMTNIHYREQDHCISAYGTILCFALGAQRTPHFLFLIFLSLATAGARTLQDPN